MNKTTYRSTSFTLPSRNQFWKQCGLFDSILEYQECAHAFFQKAYTEEFSKSGVSHPDYIYMKAKELNVKLGYFDVPDYEKYLYGCYLIPSMGLFDTFLSDYIHDVNELRFKVKLNSKSKKTKFEQILKGLKINGFIPSFEPWNIDVYNYFRKRRNAIAHGLPDSCYATDLLKASKWIPQIKSRYPNWETFLDLSGEMTFYDFLLSTTNLKNISDIMTFGLEKHLNWEKIGRSHPSFINHSKVNKYHTLTNKKIDYIRNVIHNRYGITISDADCKRFF